MANGPHKRIAVMTALVALAVVLSPRSVVAQAGSGAGEDVDELLSTEEALREVFPDAEAVVVDEWDPARTERRALEERLGRRLFEPSYPFLLVYDSAERFLGYALVTEERGKYRPITFMVGITPGVEVKGAAVMVYRESRGGEVGRKRFLRQYRGKDAGDPIRINRDIINVSGATISVRSMNAGVRKVLALVDAAFAGAPQARAPEDLRPVTSLP